MAKLIIPPHIDREKLAQRFWEKVDKTPGFGPWGDCWIWMGSRNPAGSHGSFKVGDKKRYAHRVAYDLTGGVVPDGQILRHGCNIAPCCNPAHLIPGTKKDNAQDSIDTGWSVGHSLPPHDIRFPAALPRERRQWSAWRASLPTLEERFWPKVDKSSGHGPRGDCWIWTASLRTDGYGQIRVGATFKGAHVVAYELFNGPAEKNQQILHSCDFPSCCNPAHLRAGTVRENMEDKMAKGRHRAVRGENQGCARLTAAQVRSARERYISRIVTYQSLADEFGVSLETVRKAILRRTWKHIP